MLCFCSQNITGVVAAISELLCVKIPSSYEVSSTPGPDRGPLAMLSGLRVGPQGGLMHRPGTPMMYPGRGGAGDMGGPHPHGAPGQLIRPGGGGPQQRMMMQQQQGHPQQHIRFHPDGPGERLGYIPAPYRPLMSKYRHNRGDVAALVSSS